MESYGTPRWIAKMYPPKTGRDHLGLGSVSSDQILPTLSPSINVLTFHPRYHSFYIFLLDEFWRRDLPRNYGAWKEFYRAREFVFSVGAYLCQQPEHGEMGNVVGGQKTSTLASQRMALYETKTKYIESPLGGYGLYYRTVMAEMGLIYPGGRGLPYPVDVPSDPLGKELASAFRRAIESTEYYKNYFSKTDTYVPIEVIQEYIHKACLCQLKTPSAPDRNILRKVFFEGGAKIAAEYRRKSMRLFLDIARQTNGKAMHEDSFRQIIYFGKTSMGSSFQPIESLELIHKQWRLYQAREYYAFALNALWRNLCDWGVKYNGERIGLPFSDLWDHLVDLLNFENLAKNFKLSSSGLTHESRLSELHNWILQATLSTKESFDDNCSVDCNINEHVLYQSVMKNQADTQTLPEMLVMLVLIYLRFGKMETRQQPEWEIAKMGADGRLSFDGFVRQTKKMVSEGRSIFDYTQYIFENYIIQQHIFVATRKIPDNTFRFRREGNKLRFFQHENNVDFMNSRFDSISTTIFDLGFCGNLHLPEHDLTVDGEDFLLGSE